MSCLKDGAFTIRIDDEPLHLPSNSRLYEETVVVGLISSFGTGYCMLASTLDRARSKPRVYIGCMKSGPVLSQKSIRYHEPEYWKFEEEGSLAKDESKSKRRKPNTFTLAFKTQLFYDEIWSICKIHVRNNECCRCVAELIAVCF
nr:beta-1,3-galactosyltransferase 7 isoform X2 [Tanacetum cinerariifolium]